MPIIERKMSAARRKKAGGRWFLFWLAFFIGIALLFMANMESIKGTIKETRILEKLIKSRGDEPEEDPAFELERHIQDLADAAAEQNIPDLAQAGLPAAGTEQNEPEGVQEKPDLPGNTVERAVYLMRVDTAGTILQTSVKRSLPASDRPLFDALDALIKGPSASEEKQGLISLIPRNVKIQNATIRGNTAYISLSEDFLFNTYGVEGYAGQLRQIVLTATEFSNIKDVQILIDGKRVDYLGEGIWIGSPVSRSML